MERNNYVVNSLYISNFKPFPFMAPPKKIFFTDTSMKAIQFMMLSGSNGYGKTSIFQAIEFALGGKVEIFEFKDTTNKYTDHITVNELGKESLVALELFNSNTRKYISVIRYNSNSKPCKESDCRKEFKDFNLYILEGQFNYNKFINLINTRQIETTVTNELSRILGENNITEWLNINYIKQEQSSNLLFKSNSERVNFINQFIDKSCEEYFQEFKKEDENLKLRIKEVKLDIEKLKSNSVEVEKESIGEKPQAVVLFNDKNLYWDKSEYAVGEDFQQYIQKLNSLDLFSNNIEIYDLFYKISEIKNLQHQYKLLQEIIVYSYFESSIDSYMHEYQKKTYLKNLITDKKALLTNKLDSGYLSDYLIRKISTLKQNTENVEKLSNNKQKMYSQTKDFREYILSSLQDFNNVFYNSCPLCGHNYQNEEYTLEQSIKNYNSIFNECNYVLNESLRILSSSNDNEYSSIKSEIKESIETIKSEDEVYEYMCNIQKDTKKYKKIKESVEFLLDDNINSYNYTSVSFKDIEDISKDIISRLVKLEEEYKKKFNEISIDIFDESIFEENKSYLSFLRSINIDEFKRIIQLKKLLLDWYLKKQQYDKYSKTQSDIIKNAKSLRDLLIHSAKIQKILKCVENAKNIYMGDLIKYIEIPLYIYSGKLLQTHQNGLGVFCTTGASNDKVTQFKLTTNGNASGHDILNKFSSGQKAVINIAVMLAFRKIRKSAFDLFMIDDPCQSMDDISIASLTEILRSEFQNTQILISTHEDNIAGYMCYKYYKSGKVSKNFNIQKELYSNII